MQSLEQALQTYPRPYLTDTELSLYLKNTDNSRYSKVKRLLEQNKLLHLRRGLYCLTPQMGYLKKPHPFVLAEPIYGPSYISFESALSFHGLIPEAVYTITSACVKRSKIFKTPLGVFSYSHLPLENFYLGTERITENNEIFLMATPWKAICDYLFYYKKEWDSMAPLVKSLRIDIEKLPQLSEQDSENLKEYYHHSRIDRFLKKIKKEVYDEY